MDKTTRSYIIYFGLAIFCFILAGKAEKTNNKKLIFIIALVLSFFSGYRKNTVGIDTNNYYWTFNSLKSLSDCTRYNDSGFYMIAYLLTKIKDDPYFPILIFSIATNFLMVFRLWDFNGLSSYKYAILRYITIFYFFSFNCMRQFLSVSIVFFGTKYIEKGEYGKFLIAVLAGFVVHASALLSISFLFLESYKWKKLTVKQRNLISISILLIPLYVLILMNATKGRYERYFTNISISSYSSLIIKLILLLIVGFVFYNNKNIQRKSRKMWLTFIFYGIGLLGITLGTFYRYMERIGYYFYVYATVYTGIAANYKKYLLLFRMIILFIVIRAFILNCNTNAMGQMPYLFNWE